MPPSEGRIDPSSPTISHSGKAQTKGKTSSIIRVKPGPLAAMASSMPKAPAATKEKISATTPMVESFDFLRDSELFSLIPNLL